MLMPKLCEAQPTCINKHLHGSCTTVALPQRVSQSGTAHVICYVRIDTHDVDVSRAPWLARVPGSAVETRPRYADTGVRCTVQQ
jgi:hypothetical protein